MILFIQDSKGNEVAEVRADIGYAPDVIVRGDDLYKRVHLIRCGGAIYRPAVTMKVDAHWAVQPWGTL